MPLMLTMLLLGLASCSPAPIPLDTLNQNLASGLTSEQCLARFGEPLHNFGAAEPIYQYPVKEGGSVMLTFSPTLESAVYRPTDTSSQQLFPK